MGATRFQPGSCCGCSPCKPCPLPGSALTLSWTFNPATGNVCTATSTLAYMGLSGGTYTWQQTCQAVTGSAAITYSFTFSITCTSTTTILTATVWELSSTCAAGLTLVYQYNSGGGGTLSIASHTCSPLNIVFKDGTLWTLTLTP